MAKNSLLTSNSRPGIENIATASENCNNCLLLDFCARGGSAGECREEQINLNKQNNEQTQDLIERLFGKH
jgi:hypothetical protein